MRILIVEDEKKLAGLMKKALREDGHAVDVSLDGSEGDFMASSEDYDVVVLDLMLPGKDGASILKHLRSSGKSTMVLVVTARDTVPDRVRGLDQGADDYLTKPFSFDELRARIRALLRRGGPGTPTELAYADVSVDLLRRTVTRGERELTLTQKEFALLEFFLRSPEVVLTRTSIAEHVWDYNFEWNSNVVDVFVNSLRRKLEEAGESRIIYTVRGAGYVLREN